MKRIFFRLPLVLSAALFAMSSQAADQVQVAGSSTLKDAVALWAQAFDQSHPGVQVSVHGEGSGTGFKAMSMGSADLVSSSRPILPYEQSILASQNIALEPHVVGYDALSVFVHPANPLKSVSLAQLREVFGELGKVKKWDELGVSVPGCKTGRIELIGRPENSGTRADFAGVLAVPNGLKLARAMGNSKAVLAAVAAEPCAIGYGAFSRDNTVRPLCVAKEAGKPCVTPEQGLAGAEYPMMRELYVYGPQHASGRAAEFLAFATGPEAACLMAKGTTQRPALTPGNCP